MEGRIALKAPPCGPSRGKDPQHRVSQSQRYSSRCWQGFAFGQSPNQIRAPQDDQASPRKRDKGSEVECECRQFFIFARSLLRRGARCGGRFGEGPPSLRARFNSCPRTQRPLGLDLLGRRCAGVHALFQLLQLLPQVQELLLQRRKPILHGFSLQADKDSIPV